MEKKLRQIIREEIRGILKESLDGPFSPIEHRTAELTYNTISGVKKLMLKAKGLDKEQFIMNILKQNPIDYAEEVQSLQEMGEEDPVQLAQDMIKSDEETIKSLELELKFREADYRVSNLPGEERDARRAAAKEVKDRLEMAKAGLEMAKQQQINSVMQQQQQASMDTEQGGSTQVVPQT